MTRQPTNDEYILLMRRWNASNCEAEKNEIATTILKGLNKLIWLIVRRRGRHIPESLQDDCFSEACLCIVRQAIPNFKEDKMLNAKFSSYCGNWASSAIGRYISTFNSVVYIPAEGRKKAKIAKDEGKELTSRQMAYLPNVIYWDKTNTSGDGDNNGRPLSELICESEGLANQNEAFENINTEQRKKFANKLISEIDTDRDRKIVKAILEGRSFRDVAVEVGLSRQGVCNAYKKQIEIMQEKVRLSKQAKNNAKYKRKKEPEAGRIEVIDRRVEKVEPVEKRSIKLCKKVLSRRRFERSSAN